jgi:PEP-CTERM motif-containing protein
MRYNLSAAGLNNAAENRGRPLLAPYQRTATGVLRLFGGTYYMTGIRSRARQLSLSLAGILVLFLFVGPAFVPQELRADAASRIAGLAQYFDTALASAWHSAFPSRGSDTRGDSANHDSSGSHPGMPVTLTEVGAPPSTAAGEGLIDINGLDLGSFNGGHGSPSNSIASLLSDILKDGNLGTGEGFEAFGRSSGGGGIDSASSIGGGGHPSGGTGASAGGASPAGLKHSSSSKSSPLVSTQSHGRNAEGTLRYTDVKPDTHPDAHQDRVTEPGDSFLSAYDATGTSWKPAASSEPLNDPFSGEPWASSWSDGTHGGDARNAVDPANGDLVGQLLNQVDHSLQGEEHRVQGEEHPLQGEDFRGSVFENEVHSGADSDGGDGHLLHFKNTADNSPQIEDHGSFDKSVFTPERGTGPVSSVPEPTSLVLLSLGLWAILLWRKLRSAR